MPAPTRRALLATPGLLLPSLALGQGRGPFPARPVRIIVPYTTGGVSDITARILAQRLTELWGQPVAVDNRPGANGIIGTEAVARAAPDGHTLGVAGLAHAVNPALTRMPFDTGKELAHITFTAETPQLLLAAPAFPPNTAQELIDYAKQRPGAVTFANIGGLQMELFCQQAGVEMTKIPYRGSTQAHPDIMANRVNVVLDSVAATIGHVQGGRLKVLASAGSRRTPQVPDVPTIAETALPGFESVLWGILFAPAGTPEAVQTKIFTDCVGILNTPEVVQRHATLGAQVATSESPAAAQRRMHDEIVKWTALANSLGLEKEAPG